MNETGLSYVNPRDVRSNRASRVIRLFRRIALAFLAMTVLVAGWDVLTYDATEWQVDYARLKRDMARGYANLDWMVEHRKLDLPAIDRETTTAIDNAHSRVRAFLAIRLFVQRFKDPHLRLVFERGERPLADPLPLVTAASVAVAEQTTFVDRPAGGSCGNAGYEEGRHAFVFPFERIPGFRSVGGGDFPTAMIGDTGVLRIAQLGEDQYLSACESVYRAGIGERALKLEVRKLQQSRLRAAIAELQAQGASRLLVDITGNGGGTEWVREAIALMTDLPLDRDAARLLADSCDRSGIWRGEPVCPALAFPGKPVRIQGLGAWRGPLLVLVDRGTGSAAEDFVAWLKINGVATVLGETTAGAGGGYVNGGTRTRLRATPFSVRMPNCARFLADGTNEIEGIAPGISLPMQDKNTDAKAAALASALAR